MRFCRVIRSMTCQEGKLDIMLILITSNFLLTVYSLYIIVSKYTLFNNFQLDINFGNKRLT